MTTFIEVTGTNNPLNAFVGVSTPTFADLDSDGDLDAIMRSSDGALSYLKNIGNANNPSYSTQNGTSNPFNEFDFSNSPVPIFVDLDGDGDLDALAGATDGSLRYFENIGNVTDPLYSEQGGTANPFFGLSEGEFSVPAFADLDGDGDFDLAVTAFEAITSYFENTGDVSNPKYMKLSGTENPLNIIQTPYSSKLTFADLDDDGDLDAIYGEVFFFGGFPPTLKYFENTGDATNPNYLRTTRMSRRDSPLNKFEATGNVPSFADLDGDGDLDAAFREPSGTLQYFKNLENITTDVNLTTNSLTITDIRGNASDTLSLTQSGRFLRIENANDNMIQASNNVIKNNNTVDVLLSSIVGPITINTFTGDDLIIASTHLDLNLDAGRNNDTIIGGSGNDLLIGERGKDSINGGQGDDSINGGIGTDILNGQNGNDHILGFKDDDTINGGQGNDSISAGRGNDMVFGTTGQDHLNGNIGHDSVNGGSGRDILMGGRGSDHLIGGHDLDILNGADNISFGSDERDTLVGGRGFQDRFKLGGTAGAYYLDRDLGGRSSARILDFERLDRIILTGSSRDYRIATSGGDSFILKREAGVDDAVGIIKNIVGLNLVDIQFIYI